MIDDILLEAEDKMEKAIAVAREDFSTLRTGRVNPAMFSKINVDYYGAPTPLNQLASFHAADARMMLITPFDRGSTNAVEKAIRDSDLGLNPASAGDMIRVPMPALTEERRRDLIKVVKTEGESARVAVRNLRRDANSTLKDGVKEKEISEDDERRGQDVVQKLTDAYIAEIDKLLTQKEQELLQV